MKYFDRTFKRLFFLLELIPKLYIFKYLLPVYNEQSIYNEFVYLVFSLSCVWYVWLVTHQITAQIG
jgi:hypothetical protein